MQTGNADAFEDQRGLQRRLERLPRRPRGFFLRRHRGMLGPARIGLRAGGIDHHIRAELFGKRATGRRIIRRNDRTQALDLQRSDDRQPNRSAADHERHLAALHPRLLDRVHADRQRLGQRGMLRRQPVRHFQKQRFAEQHAFGITADIVVGIADALRPGRRQQRRQRADPRSRLELLLRARPVVDDLAAEFVAEHDVARGVHRLATGDAGRPSRRDDARACAHAGRSRRCRRRAS